ncbi:MAG: protein-disulfide reductase DsbD family protein [Enhygromyxa sp.]
MSKLALVASLLASTALWACAGSGGETPAQGKDGKDGKDAAAQKSDDGQAIAGKPVEGEGKVARAPGSGATDKEYTLQIEPQEAAAGEESKVSIRVIPQGEWHMNLEYPTKLTIEPPEGTTVAKPKLDKGDAVKLDEEGCEFAVAFTPAEAGAKTFTGEFKFAVCQDEACVPKTEKLQFEVAVK